MTVFVQGLSASPAPSPRLRWLWVLLTGLGLFGAVLAVLHATGDPVYVPGLLLIGAAVVPVTLSILVADFEPAHRFPLSGILTGAVLGGVAAAVLAGMLEFETQRGLGTLPPTMIGVIEESAKLVLPVLIAWHSRRSRAVDGLVLGVAVGSVFAALETMGYAFVTLLAAQGHLEPVAHILILRAAASIGGHAAWTGLACAALFALRGARRPLLAWARFLAVFVLVAGLHAQWDRSVGGNGYLAIERSASCS